MPLSESDRQALRERAAGLRVELSSQVGRRDSAVTEATQNSEDARLLAEVASLEDQVASATSSADSAEGRVEDAAAIMEQAAARQAEAVRETDPTGESVPTPATDNTTPDKSVQGPIDSADLLPAALDVTQPETAPEAAKRKGGSN